MIDSIRETQLLDDQGRAATADYRLFTTDCTRFIKDVADLNAQPVPPGTGPHQYVPAPVRARMGMGMDTSAGKT